MSPREPAPATARRSRPAVLAALAAVLAASAVAACQAPPTPAPTSVAPAAAPGRPDGRGDAPRSERPDGSDGTVPDGTTVFDDALPAVANLDPALRDALQDAARDADDDGVTFDVTSGWRSADYQDRLLREAVAQYGSAAEAARWVATASTSPHVSGDAVDLAQTGATEWLSGRGAAYGLCQVYRNEPWHYELRPAAVDDGCPDMYADPSEDPRMQQ